MNNVKFVVGSLLAGVMYFFAGWIMYGILLRDLINAHVTNREAFLPGEEMSFPALIAGNLLYGFLFGFILLKAGVRSAKEGAFIAAVVGLLLSLAVNLMIYAQTNLYSINILLPDSLASVIINALVGAAVGWYYGRGPLNKAV